MYSLSVARINPLPELTQILSKHVGAREKLPMKLCLQLSSLNSCSQVAGALPTQSFTVKVHGLGKSNQVPNDRATPVAISQGMTS